MASVLMWIGIGLTVGGWIALAWQASIRMREKDEIAKFPQKRQLMKLRRNYCLLTIMAGIVMLVIAMII